MGALCSSLCVPKEEKKTTKVAESPVKDPKDVTAMVPTTAQTENRQLLQAKPPTSMSITNDKAGPKKISDTGSSSHISIKDFTWIKVIDLYSVPR